MVCSEPLQLALTATSSFIFRPKIFHSLFNSTPNSRKLTSFMLLKYLGDSIQSGGNQSSNSVPRFSKFVYRKKKKSFEGFCISEHSHFFPIAGDPPAKSSPTGLQATHSHTHTNELFHVIFRWVITMLAHKFSKLLYGFIWWTLQFHVNKSFRIIEYFCHLNRMQNITATENLARIIQTKMYQT